MSRKRKQKSTQTIAQPPAVPKEYKDQEIEGGWKVFLPGTGLSYAKFVPREERERRERDHHV